MNYINENYNSGSFGDDIEIFVRVSRLPALI